MARSPKASGRRRRNAPPLDELGGTTDGGLAILGQDGQLIHMTPTRVASALRYFLARLQLHESQGMPERLAMTSALVGEGVTYLTRSLAAAIAYDTEASVCIVDMTFRRPTTGENTSKRRRRGRGEEVPAKPVTASDPTDGPTAGVADDAATPAADSTDSTDSADSTESTESTASTDGTDTTVAADGGAPRQLTLADAVEHGADVEDIIVPTSNPRLCMIPAGAVAVARRPAVAQGRPIANVLDQLDDEFDYLLLDLPPVLLSSDAMNLSQLADAYVLVVRQGATSESQVEAALDELQGVDTLGVILNRFGSNIPRRLRRLVGT